jgi:hypothetical protein
VINYVRKAFVLTVAAAIAFKQYLYLLQVVRLIEGLREQNATQNTEIVTIGF